MDLGVPELLIIAFIVVLLFGSKKLPGAAKSIGQSLKIFKDETKGLRNEDEVPTAPIATAAPTVPVTPPVALTAPTAPVAPVSPVHAAPVPPLVVPSDAPVAHHADSAARS